MATSNRLSFQQLLEDGIRLPDGEKIGIEKVFIPRIQRAYAQGRKAEYEVRKSFLEDIFNCLCDAEGTNQVMELSFLFGSKQPLVNGGEGFELLDGQQRITTLFLLHWYLWMKEKSQSQDSIPDFFKKFTYETRDTSNQFISKIVERTLPLGGEAPSRAIKSLKWFTEVFNCDATVCAMLNMLDAIDKEYKKRGCSNLFDKLGNLQFYVLYLDEFELNDELYVKMNSRGLDLTPFENFKASLVRFMKKKEGKFMENVEHTNGVTMPYYLRFSTKMDTTWNDIFWEMPSVPSGAVTDVVSINNQEKDVNFFRFFVRYFFTKLVLNFDDKKEDYKPLEDFFYKNIYKAGEVETAESDHALKGRLTGWDNFEKILDKLGYDGICKIEKVLDVFAKHGLELRNIINGNPYDNWNWDVYSEYKNYTLPNRVVFAAIIEFIENIPDGMDFDDNIIQKNLNQMCRVMWNIIENTKIEDIKPVISVIKAMTEMIRLPGAVNNDFYTSIANNQVSSRNTQLTEEIEKAQKISDSYKIDPDWENRFVKAEKHPFFKGMVRFFFEDTIGLSKDFEDRYNLIGSLFDANGIAQPYRINHLLIRAIMSTMNFWNGNDGLKGKYITENAEKEGYLKILLGTKGAKDLFNGFFGSSFTSINDYLDDVVKKAVWSTASEPKQARVFGRLVNGGTAVELLNQMFAIEADRIKNNKKYRQFCVADYYGVIVACIPYNERIVLDTERHLIFNDLAANDGFTFTDPGQGKSMKSALNDVFGADVSMQKVVMDSKGKAIELFVVFDAWKNVHFDIKVNGTDINPISIYLDQMADKYRFKFPSAVTYNIAVDYFSIKNHVDQIESMLSKL